MSEKDQIENLVREYNAIEEAQTNRLWEIFKLLDAGSGYRAVRFGNHAVWSNCWGRPERLNHNDFIKPLERTITEVKFGN